MCYSSEVVYRKGTETPVPKPGMILAGFVNAIARAVLNGKASGTRRDALRACSHQATKELPNQFKHNK